RDEMRYVEVAREMIVEGRWAVPHLNQVLYSEKPPLFFWLMRVPNALEGDLTPAGARSVIAVMAALCVALTFAIGRLLLGPVGAGVSALALATSAEFARFSQTAVMDVPLALFVTAALFFYVLAKRRPTRASALPMAAAYASMGLGFMVKGPFGILLPAVVMACEGFRARGGRALKARHLRWGPLITIGILLAWVIPVIVSLGPDFAIDTLKRQLLTRAVGQAAPHAGPIWFYFAELPVEFLPWTIFVPFAFVATWRHRFAPPHPESAAEGLRFGAVWTVAMFVVLTAIKGKRDQYLMPLFPGAALLVGAWFEHVWHGVRREEHPWFEPTRKVVGAALAGTAALGLVGAFVVPAIVRVLGLEATEFASVMGTDGWMPLWWALLAAPLALAAAALIGRGRPPAVFAGVLLVGAALVLFTNLQVRPSLNWKRSGRWIGERMGELHRDGAVLGAFRWRMVGTYNYYGRVARIE
ncbi:MAG: glycosyltransferase family 39 protein, partial [Myxococcales bacterium]|nr:glycosyltransferase family 39 protein [Myxococcales bacterium]